MSSEKNNKISLRSVFWTVIIISSIISFFVFFDGRIDKQVQSHPSVVRLEGKWESLDERLERMEKKIDKILEKDDFSVGKR